YLSCGSDARYRSPTRERGEWKDAATQRRGDAARGRAATVRGRAATVRGRAATVRERETQEQAQLSSANETNGERVAVGGAPVRLDAGPDDEDHPGDSPGS